MIHSWLIPDEEYSGPSSPCPILGSSIIWDIELSSENIWNRNLMISLIMVWGGHLGQLKTLQAPSNDGLGGDRPTPKKASLIF